VAPATSPLKICQHAVAPAVVLAPMAGITNVAMNFGCPKSTH
jgi:tRNA-dihydrouridine synthase